MFEVTGPVLEGYRAQGEVYPCRSNRASRLGHVCKRYLTFLRTRWQDEEPLTGERLAVFEGGRAIEELAKWELKEKGGFYVADGREAALSFELPDQQITGHLDCKIGRTSPAKIPCEIKSMSKNHFDKIFTAEDMLKAKQPWVRSYPAQLQLYEFGSDEEEGLFYIKCMPGFQPREIWMPLDYGFCEALLRKAEEINRHVAAKTLPDRIDDVETCIKCGFRHICLPDLKVAEGMVVIPDSMLADVIARLEELAPGAKEHKKLNDEVNATVKGQPKLIVGTEEGPQFLITGKWIPTHTKAKEASDGEYWKKKIVRL